MVDVYGRRCTHDSCQTMPSFGAEGNKTAAFRTSHADDGMVNVSSPRCSHDSCSRLATWVVPIDVMATLCATHKSGIQATALSTSQPCAEWMVVGNSRGGDSVAKENTHPLPSLRLSSRRAHLHCRNGSQQNKLSPSVLPCRKGLFIPRQNWVFVLNYVVVNRDFVWRG